MTNLANVALEAWEVVVFDDRDATRRPVVRFTADTALNPNVNQTEGDARFLPGPIASGETRERPFLLAEIPVSPSAEVRMLLFEDLSSEGSGDGVTRVPAARERSARSLQLWSDALQAASRMPPSQARTYLRKALSAEERSVDSADGFAAAMRLSISEVIEFPDATFLERMPAIKRRLAWQNRERTELGQYDLRTGQLWVRARTWIRFKELAGVRYLLLS